MCIHHASLEMTLLNVAINGTDASCILGVCVYRKKVQVSTVNSLTQCGMR